MILIGVRVHLVLVLDLLVLLVVCVHLREHHRWVVLPQNAGCLLVLWSELLAVATPWRV
uniref:Uncharacterized protein n=1 Tax=Arundo donax TaxID=35708 RepID=A0A0A9GJE1_ARUDO